MLERRFTTEFIIGMRILSMSIHAAKTIKMNVTQYSENVRGVMFVEVSYKKSLKVLHIGGILWIRYTANAFSAIELITLL